MRVYWRLSQIPELATLSRAKRGLIWSRVYRNAFRHWQTWGGLAACGVLVGIGSHVGGLFGHSYIGAAIGGGVGGFVFSQVIIHVVRSHCKHLFASDDSA